MDEIATTPAEAATAARPGQAGPAAPGGSAATPPPPAPVPDLRPGTASLWRHRDFLKLWVGQTASQLGGQVSLLALPLVAVIALQAPPAQVGLLASAEQVPFLLVSLFAGVLVDRWRRRDILVVADFGRAMALAAIMVAYLMDRLGMSTLYVVAFLVGTCTVFFEIAYQAYLPRLVDREQLGRGNSLLETSRSAAQIGGPALGGTMIQLLTAPVAVAGSVVSFGLSALLISRIRAPENRPAPGAGGEGTTGALRQIRDGLRLVARNPSLRAMAITAGIYNFSSSGCMTVYLLFLPRELHLSPGAIGVVFAALGPGFLLATILSGWLPKRIGYGPTLVLVWAVACGVITAIAAVRGNGFVAVGLLMAINFAYAASAQTGNIVALTIRQAMTPDEMQGRVAATVRFVALSAAPFGAAFGGFLTGALGPRTGVLITAIGMCLALVFLLPSPLARLRHEIPAIAPRPR